MHRKTVFENGLRVITQEIPSTSAVTVLVLAGAGSRYETKEINGISHFLEHMFFKGAKKYPDAKSVSAAIDAVGGDFNAFTGKEYAGYYVKVAEKNKNTALDVLSDMLLYSKFDNTEIDKERRVILEEYNMYQDTPMYQVGWDFEKLLFGDQPLGWDQVGSKEFILNAHHEDFSNYKNSLYSADNIVVVISGKVDHDKIIPDIEKYFAFNNSKKDFEYKKYKISENTNNVLVQNKSTEQGHLVLGFPAYSEQHADHYALKVLSVILGGNMSSRMFSAIREKKGLTYYIHTSTDDYQDIGVISTNAGVDVKRIEEAVSSIIHEYALIKKEGVPEDELKKAKDFIKGKMTLRLEDSEEFAHLLGKQELLHNKIRTPSEIMKEIDKVTKEDILRICRDLFVQEKMKLAVIGPFGNGENLKNLMEVKF
ncbi:MAG: Peptidase, M16 family [Candidatus Peregrinibacteria bacterium GW2011_GWA2_33_10]|nr:MAG: Peptidase, M16 family [Candidatus Peregrinibacteria bacterium GW2011_GWA2_33_10]KKP40901.1 MAG: peptidase M16 domain-containing protein [Candidatus Peregrinibacteria bacterium GW2011_GWC2_33_13]OGJ50157.1 MAG: hypothetical protein A2229_00320 [Candidatus Peregrinibacteria bacterium RIFOXYA2_FULL_33_7]